MRKTLIILFTLFVASTAHALPVTLAGDQIDAAMIRTVNTGYGLGRITGYGLDAPFVVQDGTADIRQYSSAFRLNVDGSGFLINFISTAGWQDGIILQLSDLDFSVPGSYLSSLAVDTNLAGYLLTVTPDAIEIGLGGTKFTPTTYFGGTFHVSEPEPVPEPATFSLVALGLAGIGFATRMARLRGAKRQEVVS